MYVLQSHITAFVPTAVVKDILIQGDSEGKRGKWIAKIQEYELDIRPTKLIKGQGLAKILSESNCQALGINLSMTTNEDTGAREEAQRIEIASQKVHMKYLISPWYKELVEYLLTLSCPSSCEKNKYRSLRLKSQKYMVANGRLYWWDPSGILLMCLTEEEVESIMAEFHEGICGGHYSWRATAQNILKFGFFLPKLFGDVFA